MQKGTSKRNKYNKIDNNTSIENLRKGRNTLLEAKKSQKKFITIYILIFFSFLFMLILSSIIINSSYFTNEKYTDNNYVIEEEDEDDNYKPDNKSIYFEEKFYSYQEAYNKAKDFINDNLKGLLINTEKVELSKKPNVSVVIPCCNCKKYILRAIRSIQNQDFSNYEIIIANDGSKDGSLSYIQELQKIYFKLYKVYSKSRFFKF
jgi:GT2 family glycosyltransferase